MIDATIGGDCAPELTAVREEFVRNFAERGEVGAALCVIRQGELVVDLRGGWADGSRTRPWAGDTLVNHYSASKAMLAALVLRLVDDGTLSLETRVAEVWPEFAAHGKHAATVRDALCHRAAVPAIRRPMTDDDLFDWSTMTDALAATEPWWPIGTRHAYHANTYGHLNGEIVRRVVGETPGTVLAELAAELDADLWIGVPEDQHHRCADVVWDASEIGDPTSIDIWALDGDLRMRALAYLNPPGYSSMGVLNTARWRSAEVPSTNGHSTARGLAQFYAALLEPDRILSASLLRLATRPQSVGPCPILEEDAAFGLGFTPTTDRRPLGPNPHSFGHFGTGGALGFADPDTGIAFGYVMNHVVPRWRSTRNRALIDALYAS